MSKLSRRAVRDLEELPDALRAKAQKIIDDLDQNPSAGKKLLGALAGKRSVRLGRTHRIIYKTEPEIYVITVAPRKDVYR